MNMKVKPQSSSIFAYSYCLLFFFLVSFDISNAQTATTDPSEVRALNSIFQQWDAQAVALWNISGNPCSGSAVNDTDLEDPMNNPSIKCDCTYSNGTICHVTQLSIAHNMFSGTIPKELGDLKELNMLSLASNNFSGTLPPELGNLVKLEQIYVDSSGLGGEIPSTFSNLQNMRIMRVSDSPFTGRIPDFIGNWTKLTALRIQGNSFEGPIPSSFSNLTSLQSLRISDIYNVSSSLDFIINLTSLTNLVLRNALITGNIPSDIGEYKMLQILDLSFNNLTGEIPSGLFSISSLQFLFLGNNSLSGTLPSLKSEGLLNVDFSYNQLSGGFPSWVTASSNLQLNLVANNFVFDKSNISVMPGLNCLQRNFPCNRNSPLYANFSIKCGGPEMPAEGIVYDAENSSSFGAAWYYVTNTEKWAVSNVGLFAERTDQSYVQHTESQVIATNIPELYQTSRMSPESLRYYGLGLDNGLYNVSLFFAETGFDYRSSQTWKSQGRRVFDIYIQGSLELKDFDISKEAGGVERALPKIFRANVSENYLEIHLFWAGKGTCCVPIQGYYGPLISAIHVVSDFVSNVTGIPLSNRGKKSRLGLIVGIAVPVGVVSLIFIFAVFYMKRKPQHNNEDELLGIVLRPSTFSYAELRSATEDFNPSKKLGEGGFGPVFKGTLSDGRIVAVKQLSVASHQGKRQFVTEISTISAVQHCNLVKLYGCCIEGERRLLVYEYLENGSLDQALFGKSKLRLDWPTRFSVCLGTARGLAYLHEESRPRIVHRDVKASNILIDGKLCPKISDFGLAKLYDDTKTHISTRVAGTIGYLAPEYAMRGHLTDKADVFGFGVVALEILSGRPNSDNSLDTEKIYLLEWAWTLHENNQSLRLVDPKLSEFDENEAARVMAVSLMCTQASPNMRPPMSRVVAMLAGDIEVGIVTSKPSYLTDWNFKDITRSFLSEEDRKHHEGSTDLSQLGDPLPSSINVTETMIGGIIGDGR
ncbi:probable LRR receptor-like serine/threonine-protein kinase At1g56130 isoform X4 [Quercus suber]|uniref:probable LRR receptor-like serine/threonine-protein kinase At1g56130 isoform X4 n=1 Tax=Quercus suber TaxID=58331 RepID=UPI0032DE39A1